jgi:hypothetical protein
LAARHGALSCDHVEYVGADGVAAMAAAGTVAVILPGAFYTLRETQAPPIAAFRKAGVPMAVATDLNPGTAPVASLPLAMNMACTLFRLTPAEALAGATCHAARALGLADRGRIAPGQRADLMPVGYRPPRRTILSHRLGPAAAAHLRRPNLMSSLDPDPRPGHPGRPCRPLLRRAGLPVRLDPAARPGVEAAAARIAAAAAGEAGLRRQHRLWQTRLGQDRGGRHGNPAAQPDPVALLRRGRPDARRRCPT